MKADVAVGAAACTVKVRIWYQQTEPRAYCVEFQRRDGDMLSFGHCYQQAVQYLQQQLPGAVSCTATDVQVSPTALETTSDVADVSPLLDMAGQSGLPRLQAESASALAAIAEARAGATPSALCDDYACQQFKKLLEAGTQDVQYPTARLLNFLASTPDAAHRLASEGLVSIILEQVLQAVTEQRLQLQLVQAVLMVVSNCAATLPDQQFQDARAALMAALQAREQENSGPVYRSLYEAYTTLEQRAPPPLQPPALARAF